MSENTSDKTEWNNVYDIADRRRQNAETKAVHPLEKYRVKPQAEVPTGPIPRLQIPPEKDPIVNMSLKLVRVAEDSADIHPIQTMAAYKVAIDVLHESFLKKYGPEETMRIIKAAHQIGSRYQPVFKEDKPEENS